MARYFTRRFHILFTHCVLIVLISVVNAVSQCARENSALALMLSREMALTHSDARARVSAMCMNDFVWILSDCCRVIQKIFFQKLRLLDMGGLLHCG